MQLAPDAEAMLLLSIRRVPDEQRQDAFDLAASLLRPYREPSEANVRSTCHTINETFSPLWRRENCGERAITPRTPSRKRSAGSLRARSGVFSTGAKD